MSDQVELPQVELPQVELQKVEDVKDVELESLIKRVFTENKLRNAISAYEIILEIMTIVEKHKTAKKESGRKLQLALNILEQVAKGLDCKEGTDDDIIKPEVMSQVRVLLDNKLVEGFIESAIALSKGIFSKLNAKGCNKCW